MSRPTPAAELEYAGFWLRVAACLIDTVLFLIVSVPMLMRIYGPTYWSNPHWIAGPADFLISWVMPTVLTVACWQIWQATPGKLAIAARVVDATTGGKPSLLQLIVRALGYFVSGAALGMGFIWVAFDLRKQGWHDKMARTVVVRPQVRGALPVRFEQGPPSVANDY